MKPVLQALVLAERVYEDKSGRKIIAGTFNKIAIGKRENVPRELPDGRIIRLLPGGIDIGCPSLYVSLTDVVDGTEILIQFLDISKNEVVFSSPVIRLNATNRLETIEIAAPLPRINDFIKRAGNFAFDVMWRNEILGFYRVTVVDQGTQNLGGT